MRELQQLVARAAIFTDEPSLDPTAIDDLRIAGVDQAFLEERAVSAVVVREAGETVDRVHAVTPLEVPYIPGFLSFREGPPILAALAELALEPDLILFDGSGRLHYRQAGLATHLGVVFDVPSVGVAKGLLCGNPTRSVDRLETGERIHIEADDEVDAPEGTVLGEAVQTRQFEGRNRTINPVYVSPGHRCSVDTASEVVLGTVADYKLPEPIREADAHASAVKARVADKL